MIRDYAKLKLPKPSKSWDNRATVVFFFLHCNQVNTFVDWFTDFQRFCHRWSDGRWSPDDQPTISRLCDEIKILISAERNLLIGHQPADYHRMVDRLYFSKKKIVGRYSPDICRHSADDRHNISICSYYIVFNVLLIYTQFVKWSHALSLFGIHLSGPVLR